MATLDEQQQARLLTAIDEAIADAGITRQAFVQHFKVVGITDATFVRCCTPKGPRFSHQSARRICKAIRLDYELVINAKSTTSIARLDENFTAENFCYVLAEANRDRPEAIPVEPCSPHCELAVAVLKHTKRNQVTVLEATKDFTGDYYMAMRWSDDRIMPYRCRISTCKCGVSHFQVTKYHNEEPAHNSKGFVFCVRNVIHINIFERFRQIGFGLKFGPDLNVRPLVGSFFDVDSSGGKIEINKVIFLRIGSHASNVITPAIVDELLRNEAGTPDGVLLSSILWPSD